MPGMGRWLVADGDGEDIDVLTPERDREQNRAEPIYLTFLNTILSSSGSLEDIRDFALRYGLLGMLGREHPERVEETEYGKVARYARDRLGHYVSPRQVEKVDDYLFAAMLILDALDRRSPESLEAQERPLDRRSPESLEAQKRPLEGYGELVVMAGPTPCMEVRYRSLLDGMLLRIAYDQITDGRPYVRCAHCGRWFVQGRQWGKYCSDRCREQARDRRRSPRRKAK
ncbi:hypothetical protein U7230_13880 [Carboxydochorda subterranea]|uniref:CGNR zinc finger domain-containing protein n=1 Tax=Carboxydichorda subterranea TaxID=3109565 RepID=A0ABZ1BWH9_9FIRM|nr:hypothetical protein [Limnochorda sp. L945t]WRP17157.1 hypothetical protein U7230_13880 [Limnochorda sp. L945t]